MTGQPMEEILASIKRIIAEDAPLSLGPPTLARSEPEKQVANDADDVLELEAPSAPSLVEPANAPPGWGVREPLPPIDPTIDPGPEPVFAEPALTVNEPAEYFRGQPIAPAETPDYVTTAATLAPEPEPTVTPSAPAPVAHEAPAVPSPEPAPVSAAPFDPAILAASLEPDPGYESLLSASAEAASRQALAALSSLTIDSRAAPNTLDGLVREMLRPMVKDWLDKNLPPLVEQMVAKEIKRLARG